MQRRELLKFIATATGCAFIGAVRARVEMESMSTSIFNASDIAFFDEVAETILPRTSTPGAKDAGVGAFMAVYSNACYAPAQLAILRSGIAAVDARMQKKYGVDFLHAGAEQRTSLLLDIDREAREYAHMPGHDKNSSAPHYFTLMKQLTLYGFFTSEPGATRVARYRPVPGKYRGVVDYKPGEAIWTPL